MFERASDSASAESRSDEVVGQLYQKAVAFHRDGNFTEAKLLYERILSWDPAHFDALHNLGLLARRRNDFRRAELFFSNAGRLRADSAALCSSFGLLHHDLGRFQEAIAAYQLAIMLRPNFGLAYYNRGLTLEALGRFQEAAVSFDRAITIQPNSAELYNSSGNAFKQARRFEDALDRYIQAIALKPDYAPAFNNVGVTLKDLGRIDEALVHFDRAISISPDYFAAFNNRGVALQVSGRQSDAAESFSRSTIFNPGFAQAYYNRGVALEVLMRFDEAVLCYDRAITIKPDYAEAHNNRGNALKGLIRFEEALMSYKKAISVKPDYSDAYSNAGVVLQELRRFDEAFAVLEASISFAPDNAGAYNNCGVALKEMRRFEEAILFYGRAVLLAPRYAEAYNNRGVAFQDLKQFEDAIEDFRTAIAVDPTCFHAHSNLLFTMNYVEAFSIDARVREALRFGSSVANKASAKFGSWVSPGHSDKLRIGLFSGDFRNHPVGYFLEGLLAKIDKSRFDLFAYATNPTDDDLTKRLRNHVPVWRSLWDKNDADAARLIHGDGLHILIDLSGHTAGNRLSVFARKPAPVQSSWLGYFATTGVSEIDFFIGDPHVAPPGEEHHFCERVVRLPETYLCFTPPQSEVEVGPLPALENGFVTFGCFNNLAKLHARVVALWAKVLNAVDGSRLFLKAGQLGDPAVIQSTMEMFQIAGVDPRRLVFEGPSDRRAYFHAFNRVDIALDPFPFPGGTTSVEGLWMGVPVISLRGNRFIAHNCETIAHNCGQSDWIAQDEEDYIRKAVLFTSDLTALAKLRSGLRRQVLTSPLFDSVRFARNFEKLMLDLWADYEGRSSQG